MTSNTSAMATSTQVKIPPKKGGWEDTLAGTLGGSLQVLVGHPLDTLKVRMQTSNFSGIGECFKETLKNEGLRGLYKGMGAPLVTVSVLGSAYFGFFSYYKRALSGLTSDPNAPLPLPLIGVAGAATGVSCCALINPIELVKARLQVQYRSGAGGTQYKGPIDCGKVLIQQYGIKGIYAGLSATIATRCFTAFYFAAYEATMRAVGARTTSGDGNGLSKIAGPLLAGGAAGVAFWVTSYPLDVIKNRMQTQPELFKLSMRQAIVDVAKKDGWRGFYRGFTPCMIRAVPANAVTFFGYEMAMSLISYLSS